MAQQAQSIRTRARAVVDEGLPREVTAYLQEHWQGLFPNTNDVALEFLPGNFSTNPRPRGPAGPAAGTGPGVATPPAGRGNTACIMSEREARHRRVYDQLWDPCRVLEKMGVDPDNGP